MAEQIHHYGAQRLFVIHDENGFFVAVVFQGGLTFLPGKILETIA
jgi:hypothetical protein